MTKTNEINILDINFTRQNETARALTGISNSSWLLSSENCPLDASLELSNMMLSVYLLWVNFPECDELYFNQVVFPVMMMQLQLNSLESVLSPTPTYCEATSVTEIKRPKPNLSVIQWQFFLAVRWRNVERVSPKMLRISFCTIALLVRRVTLRSIHRFTNTRRHK